MAVLEMEDLGQVTITLRGGKEIILGDDKKNPRGNQVDVRVGRDYIEVYITPGAGVPKYEMALFSEISSVECKWRANRITPDENARRADCG
jgi:hypothetical protein